MDADKHSDVEEPVHLAKWYTEQEPTVKIGSELVTSESDTVHKDYTCV